MKKDWNYGEEDHEGEMALSQLHRLGEMVERLSQLINEGDELPGWVQSKITSSHDDLSDVFGWLDSQGHVTEGKKKKGSCSGCKGKNPGLWCNICKKRARGEKPAKPGEKGYPKTLKIESASLKKLIDRLTEI